MGRRAKINVTKKKRQYTSQHDMSMVEIALELMRNKKLSSYEAEKTFGIPRRTLLDKLHKKHPQNPGAKRRLTEDDENNIVRVLIAAGDFGSPLTLLDLRIVVKNYLEANGRKDIFDNKLPGRKWVYSFLKRHKTELTIRSTQNIKRSRAEKNTEEISEYFENLKISLDGVPKENLVNYDETNFTDNPGAQRCVFRKGVKYPERVLNHSKGAISVMFAITAAGTTLPPYVVYRAQNLYSQWTINGPKGARYNRSSSGWFDTVIFEDWFQTIILPWARTKSGPKVVIGDNLASHINPKIVKICEENNIRFVFLPPNSSHLTQPLDVCYFGPLKKIWRNILTDYKIRNPAETSVNKSHFPDLLNKVMSELNSKKAHNINSAFKATGIYPFDPNQVVKRLPDSKPQNNNYSIDNALLDYLKENRAPNPLKKVRSKKLNVPAGKSVTNADFKHEVKLDFQIKKPGTSKCNPKTSTNDSNVIVTSNISLSTRTPVKTTDFTNLEAGSSPENLQSEIRMSSLNTTPKKQIQTNILSLPGTSKDCILHYNSPNKNFSYDSTEINVTPLQNRNLNNVDSDDSIRTYISRFSLLDPSDDSNFQLSEDDDYEVQDHTLEDDDSEEIPFENNKKDINVNSFILVKFQVEKRIKFYVGQVTEMLSPVSFRVKFMRHKGKGIFNWPVVDDISVVSLSDIELVLLDAKVERRGTVKLNASYVKTYSLS